MLKKLLTICCGFLFLALQYKLWFAPGGGIDVHTMRLQIREHRQVNEAQLQSNAKMLTSIQDLKRGTEMIEEHARTELGMVKRDEVYYRFI